MYGIQENNREKIGMELTLIEVITLRLVEVGSDSMNFKILELLPTKIDNIIKVTGLSKVPVNKRVNQLERVGLAKRWRGTGLIVDTGLGADFII